MRRVEIVGQSTPAELRALIDFVAHRNAHGDAPTLSDHLALDLEAGGSAGFLAVSIRDGEQVLALAQISAANAGAVLELVVPAGPEAAAFTTDLFETAIDAFAAAGGGRLTWWVEGDDDQARQLAAAAGLVLDRTLYEMRRPLPHPQHSALVTRDFDPATDIADWLAVNNRAFAGHGEQGGWTEDTFRQRMAEPWFAPQHLRVYAPDSRMAAFCWTKVHSGAPADEAIGEIYVIAVDPDFHGRGLGRQATLAGLDHLAGLGVTTAQLYVDAANTAAYTLYDDLGFGVFRTRLAFAGTLAPGAID